jgi:anthranilate synthase component 2
VTSPEAGTAVRSRLLLLDNYDSFTYNLSHYFEELGAAVDVRLNDEVDLAWVLGEQFDAIVVSAGPGRPEEAGLTPRLVRAAAGRVPLLGVCLGHQAIAQAWGSRIVRAPLPLHGKASPVHHDGDGLFAGLPTPFPAGRYHSLTVDPGTISPELEVAARADDGTIMALRHRRLPVDGVQFHPESILTAWGKPLLASFLRRAAAWNLASRAA